MLDPTSLTAAVTAMLSAVGAGMANEAGKWAWESVGGLARRVAGHEVPAPVTAEERNDLAVLLVEGAGRDSAHARALLTLVRGVPTSRGAVAVPRLLPSSVRFFTDRQSPMRRLDREASRKPDGRPRLALLYGPEGIGTSALAVHWGSREVLRFPDGQLYADLRGDAVGNALDPAAVLPRFLRDLGVAESEIPRGRADRIGLFRNLVADRELLVVLDHAHSAAQIQPFVTSAPGVFTVVVARRPLPGLDALPILVEPLEDRDAVRLLTDLAGKQAVRAARPGLPSVLARCAGSPYALRVAAPRLSVPPSRREEHPMAENDPAPDPVRAAVEDLYRELAPDAARLYRLQALRPWPAFGSAAAAATAGIDEPEAARLLAELADLQLLDITDSGRYRYRPAVRRHAEEAAAREDGIMACAAAVRLAVEWYLHFAVRADFAALPNRWHVGPLFKALGPGPYADEGEALAALAAELDNLLEAVRAASELGDRDIVCSLCEALWAVQLKAGRHDELLPALRAGARAADSGYPGSLMAGRMHTQLALALSELQQYDEAESELRAAALAGQQAGHARGQATAVESLGLVRLRQWRFQEAYDLFDEAYAIADGIGERDPGFEDLPRIRALLERHRGRALRGLGRFDEALEHSATALRFFRVSGEAYNTARTLTDLAETHLDAGNRAVARPLVEEAIAALVKEDAEVHFPHLYALRERCVSEDE